MSAKREVRLETSAGPFSGTDILGVGEAGLQPAGQRARTSASRPRLRGHWGRVSGLTKRRPAPATLAEARAGSELFLGLTTALPSPLPHNSVARPLLRKSARQGEARLLQERRGRDPR